MAHGSLLEDGHVAACGYNQYGQLGKGFRQYGESHLGALEVLEKVQPLFRVVSAACGDRHTILLKADGGLMAFGDGSSGQLGLGSKEVWSSPMLVQLPEKIQAVACGEAHTVAITVSGKVLSWGKGEMGQLGHGNTKDQLLPRLIETFRKRAVAVACGQNHTALLTEEGQLYVMGANKYHQAGSDAGHSEGEDARILSPTLVPGFRCDTIASGGYHMLAKLNTADTCMLQHASDGNLAMVTRLFNGSVFRETLLNALDSVNGMSPLHCAALGGHAAVLRALLNGGYNVDATERNNRTALHLVAQAGFLPAAKVLLEAQAQPNRGDGEGRTPLHLAIKLKHAELAALLIRSGASVDAQDHHGKTPLDACVFERAFDYKVIANRPDVFVVAAPSDTAFVKQLITGIEKSHIKCESKPTEERPASALLQMCRGIVFVLSAASAASPECIDLLEQTKKLDKPFFPIWLQKITLTPAMESLVYRRQLVDFSSQKLFSQSLGVLVAGLRNIFRISPAAKKAAAKADLKSSSAAAGGAAGEEAAQTRYLVVSYDRSDEGVVKALQAALPSEVEVRLLLPTESREAISKRIHQCWIFVVVLSAAALASAQVRDHIALAENHRKLMFPVMAQKELEMDAGMLYTFAHAPKYDLSQLGTEQAKDNARLLAQAVLMNEFLVLRQSELTAAQQQLRETEEMLAFDDDTIRKIKRIVNKSD